MRRGCWALLALAGCTFGNSEPGDAVVSVGETQSPMLGSTGDGGTMGVFTTAEPSTASDGLASTDDGETPSTSTGPSPANGSTTEQDGSSSSSGDEDVSLVDDGLLVRYFLDDYGAGEPPQGATVKDAGPGPALDLPILVVMSQPTYAVADGHTGLSWTATDNDGRPVADVAQTKIMELDGATEVTLEVVADIEQVNGAGTRLIHIGAGSNNHSLALSADDLDSLHLRTHVSNQTAVWGTELDNGRTVYTFVIDLDEAAGDQYRLFVNGSEVEPASFVDMAALQIDDAHTITLGNRSNGDRSMVGTLFYTAIYDRALSPEEVQQNADALGESDDSP